MFFMIFMYMCERNNNNVPIMQTEMEDIVTTEILWRLELTGARTADCVNI